MYCAKPFEINGADFTLEGANLGDKVLKINKKGYFVDVIDEIKDGISKEPLQKIQMRYYLAGKIHEKAWNFILSLLNYVDAFKGEKLRFTFMAHHSEQRWDLWYKKCRNNVIAFKKCSNNKETEFLIFIEMKDKRFFLTNLQVRQLFAMLCSAKWLKKIIEFTLYIHGDEEVEIDSLRPVFEGLNAERLSVLRFFIYSMQPNPVRIHPLIKNIARFSSCLEELSFCFASDQTYTGTEVSLLEEALEAYIGKRLKTLRIYVGSQDIGPGVLKKLVNRIIEISKNNNSLSSLNLSFWNDNNNIRKDFYQFLFEKLGSLEGVYNLNLAFICLDLDNTLIDGLVNMYTSLIEKGILQLRFYSQSDSFGGSKELFETLIRKTINSSVVSADFTPERIGFWYEDSRGEYTSCVEKIKAVAQKRQQLALIGRAIQQSPLRAIFKRRLILVDIFEHHL